MTYEFHRKHYSRTLKRAKKRGHSKMSTEVKDSLGLSKVGELRDETIMKHFPFTHNLSLQSLKVDELPDDVIFPEECNRYLRNQIQELTAQNGKLLRELEEKEADLRLCINQNEQLLSNAPSPLIGLGRASELAASKIVELSKRVRELTAEYEGAKTRWRTAERKLKAYEQESGSVPQQQTEHGLDHEGLEPNENEVKALTEKLNATMNKLCESRNQNQQLKQELKLANKALASEIGEAVSLHSITSSTSNWKGRAQQILSLQQKIATLQDKLKEQNGEKFPAKNSGVTAVRQMGRERQAAHEQMARDLQERTQQLEEVKRKLETMKARCRVWETEIERKKKTIEHYMQMDDHDKELIKTLSAELKRVEKRKAERVKEENQKAAEWEEKYKMVNEECMREKSNNEQLEIILRQKEEKIQKYKALEEGNNDESGSAKLSHSVGPSSRQNSKSPESAKEQGDSQTLLLAAEAERIRLLELLSLMNQRLAEQSSRAAEAADRWRRERSKSARLEAKVGRLEMEKVGLARSGAGSYAGSRASVTSDSTAVKEGVRYKMELMEEELLALKARLDCIQQEKEQDLKIYKNAFDEAQRAFLEGSKQGSLYLGRSIFGSR